MATGSDDHRVKDDEGTVDSRIKERIIDSRKRVDKAFYKLFIEGPLEHNVAQSNYSQRATPAWGEVVKLYLLTIEPLLINEEVEVSEDYYEDAEFGGQMKIWPPDANGYPFREFAQSDINALDFKINNGIPTDVEMPEPKKVSFDGLKDVIENESVQTASWQVNIGMYDAPEHGGVINLTESKAVPQSIYKDAVRSADQFLQEIGIGVEIDTDLGDAGFSYGDLREEGLPDE